MLALHLATAPQEALSILAIGAHPDDIEIGAGGTLLSLAQGRDRLRVHYLVLTGTPERQLEARHAAAAFLPGADLTMQLCSLPEGRFPALWSEVKDLLEEVACGFVPDLIIGPQAGDAHQDHRTIAEILPTVFRDQLYLGYEIPKWDGDFSRPAVYVPMSADAAQRKTELLHKCFPSQHQRDWWDDDVFLGLARLRGMECRAPYAEAFASTKMVLSGASDSNAPGDVRNPR
jgi:LmbE family N-acetylglucosaminyl deacetylase